MPIAICNDIEIILDETGNASITSEDVGDGSTGASITIDRSSFDCTNAGINHVILTAANGCGASETCMAIVTIEAPNIVGEAELVGQQGLVTSVRYVTEMGGKLYFSGYDGNVGQELWSWDGTSFTMEADLNPGGSGFSPAQVTNEQRFFAHNNKLYFRGDGSPDYGIWCFDPTTSSATMVSTVVFAESMVELNGKLYFSAYNTNSGHNGRELYSYDLTTGVTDEVADINTTTSSASSHVSNIVVFNSKLYFAANDGSNGNELWKHDPATNTTVMVADIDPGSSPSNPTGMTEYNGKLYFEAYNLSLIHI